MLTSWYNLSMNKEIEERKLKWFNDHIEQIKEYCLKSSKEIYDKFVELQITNKTFDEFCHEVNMFENFKNNILNTEFSNCKKVVCDIDLMPYIESIVHNDYETIIFLFISNNKVVKELSIKGTGANANGLRADEIEKLANDLNESEIGFYMLHNHPLDLQAIFSGLENKDCKAGTDYADMQRLKAYFEKSKVKFLDYGVATEEDYCSAKQIGLI